MTVPFEIHSAELEKYRNDEFVQYMNQTIKINNFYDPFKLGIKPKHDALVAKCAEIDKVYVILQKSMKTESLEVADERRDLAVNGISFFVDSMLNYHVPAFRDAAKLLRANLDKYGVGIARKGYNAETAIIADIVKDLKNNDDLKEAVAIFPLLPEWLLELETANNRFDELFLLRNRENSISNPDETMKQLRLEANQLYYDLRIKLFSFANVNEFADPYDRIIKEWNTLIDSYNQTVVTREGKAAANKPSDGTTPPAPPANPT